MTRASLDGGSGVTLWLSRGKLDGCDGVASLATWKIWAVGRYGPTSGLAGTSYRLQYSTLSLGDNGRELISRPVESALDGWERRTVRGRLGSCGCCVFASLAPFFVVHVKSCLKMHKSNLFSSMRNGKINKNLSDPTLLFFLPCSNLSVFLEQCSTFHRCSFSSD